MKSNNNAMKAVRSCIIPILFTGVLLLAVFTVRYLDAANDDVDSFDAAFTDDDEDLAEAVLAGEEESDGFYGSSTSDLSSSNTLKMPRMQMAERLDEITNQWAIDNLLPYLNEQNEFAIATLSSLLDHQAMIHFLKDGMLQAMGIDGLGVVRSGWVSALDILGSMTESGGLSDSDLVFDLYSDTREQVVGVFRYNSYSNDYLLIDRMFDPPVTEFSRGSGFPSFLFGRRESSRAQITNEWALANLVPLIPIYGEGQIIFLSELLNNQSEFGSNGGMITVVGTGFDGHEVFGWVHVTDFLVDGNMDLPEVVNSEMERRQMHFLATGETGIYVDMFESDGITKVGKFFIGNYSPETGYVIYDLDTGVFAFDMDIYVVFDENYMSARLQLSLEAEKLEGLIHVTRAQLVNWNADQVNIIGFAGPYPHDSPMITVREEEGQTFIDLLAYAVHGEADEEGEKLRTERRATVKLYWISEYAVGSLMVAHHTP